MLPPSVLFRNRLIIERDSKSRRVTSNLGLTYRNSKWANFTRTDIPTNAKESYIHYCKILILSLSIFMTFLFYTNLYTTTAAFNDATLIFWWLKDTTRYYFFSLGSIFTLLSTAWAEQSLSKLFLNPKAAAARDNRLNEEYKTWFIGHMMGNQYSTLFYIYLNKANKIYKGTLNSEIEEESLAGLVSDDMLKNRREAKLALVNKTFKSSSTLKRSTFSSNFDLDLKSMLANFSSLGGLKMLETDSQFTFQNTRGQILSTPSTTSSLHMLGTLGKWDLSNLVLANERHLTGYFYTTNWNFSKYNSVWVNQSNSHALYESLENQLNSLKVSKFLYHYSYLHRNILKNSHKLTMVKKLMSSGFYDTKLISNNIWASDMFNNLEAPTTVLNSELSLVYGNFFKSKFLNKHLLNNYLINTSTNSLTLLNFYEKSYFWSLKRLHNFNNLFTNSVKFTLQPSLSAKSNEYTSSSSLNSLNLVFKSDLVTTGKFLNYNFPTQTFMTTSTHARTASIKDVFSSQTKPVLITAEEESILTELTNSPSSNTPLYPFYPCSNLSTSSYLKNHKIKKNISSFSTKSLSPSTLYVTSSTQNFPSVFSHTTFLNDVRKFITLL